MTWPQIVSARDPRYRQALAEFAEEFGFQLEQVLLPKQYYVAESDGAVLACVTPDGWSALALASPDPEAAQRVDRWIRGMKAAGLFSKGEPS